MRDYLLFVDTETSGIPEDLNLNTTYTDRWPYVLQLAWRIYGADGVLVKKENHYIYEEDIIIQKPSTKIHGIDINLLIDKGEPRKDVVKTFANDLRHYKPLIVGHFVEFDSKMIQVAFSRCGLKNIIREYPHFCTMRSTMKYARYVNRDYPRLGELYMKLFDRKLERQHNAAVDAKATAQCFFKLVEEGEITDHVVDSQLLFEEEGMENKKKFGCGLPVILAILMFVIIFFA